MKGKDMKEESITKKIGNAIQVFFVIAIVLGMILFIINSLTKPQPVETYEPEKKFNVNLSDIYFRAFRPTRVELFLPEEKFFFVKEKDDLKSFGLRQIVVRSETRGEFFCAQLSGKENLSLKYGTRMKLWNIVYFRGMASSDDSLIATVEKEK